MINSQRLIPFKVSSFKYLLKAQHKNQNTILHTFMTLVFNQFLSFVSTKLPHSH